MKWTSKYVDILLDCERDGLCGRWWGISTFWCFIGFCLDLWEQEDTGESSVASRDSPEK